MTKIIIPAKEIEESQDREKEVIVQEGDLVMLFIAEHGSDSFPIINLGVFIREYEQWGRYLIEQHKKVGYMDIDLVYTLGSCETFGGVNIFPIINSRQTHSFRLGLKTHIRDMYVEPEQIAERLRQLKGFEFHAGWIEKLQKPYLRDSS